MFVLADKLLYRFDGATDVAHEVLRFAVFLTDFGHDQLDGGAAPVRVIGRQGRFRGSNGSKAGARRRTCSRWTRSNSASSIGEDLVGGEAGIERELQFAVEFVAPNPPLAVGARQEILLEEILVFLEHTPQRAGRRF